MADQRSATRSTKLTKKRSSKVFLRQDKTFFFDSIVFRNRSFGKENETFQSRSRLWSDRRIWKRFRRCSFFPLEILDWYQVDFDDDEFHFHRNDFVQHFSRFSKIIPTVNSMRKCISKNFVEFSVIRHSKVISSRTTERIRFHFDDRWFHSDTFFVEWIKIEIKLSISMNFFFRSSFIRRAVGKNN